MNYVLAFAMAFGIALLLTPLVRRFALSRGILDRPEARKVHSEPIARLGGVAIFIAFIVTTVVFLPVDRELATLLIGCTILAGLGVVDDMRGLSAWTKLGVQIVAAGIVLSGGIGISSITNPFGGVFDLSFGRFAAHIGSFSFHITPIANALSILWMVGLINTINFLDGLDGLACGVSSITALMLFLLAISAGVNQPIVAILAIVLVGATLGFLPYNFYPAKIFMGDTGAYFLGLTLALISMYSGGKLATVGLVLGFAIIDALWAAVRRISRGGHPFRPDREHLHHLLLQVGLSQRVAVLGLYLMALVFGTVALVSNSFYKLISLIILLAVMVTLIASLVRLTRRSVRL